MLVFWRKVICNWGGHQSQSCTMLIFVQFNIIINKSIIVMQGHLFISILAETELSRISNPKSLIGLQPTKAFMRLSWCVSGIWGWEVFTTAHKVILAATSPSQMGNIAFILRGAAPQIWISQKWCVTYLGAKNPRLGWDIRRRVLGQCERRYSYELMSQQHKL